MGTITQLSDQVFVPRGPYSLTKFVSGAKPIKNMLTNKPDGGIWTSTLQGTSSSWLDWCSVEMPKWVGPQALILTNRARRIFNIGNVIDFLFLYTNYPWREGIEKFDGFSHAPKLIDWEKVLQDFDAVHITDEMADHDELHVWETESTVWARPSLLQIKAVVDVKNRCQLKMAHVAVADRWLRKTR